MLNNIIIFLEFARQTLFTLLPLKIWSHILFRNGLMWLANVNNFGKGKFMICEIQPLILLLGVQIVALKHWERCWVNFWIVFVAQERLIKKWSFYKEFSIIIMVLNLFSQLNLLFKWLILSSLFFFKQVLHLTCCFFWLIL